MAAFSRRQLARYAVDQLLDRRPATEISNHLAAALIAGKMTKQADLLLDDIAEELESRGLLARAVVTSANGLSAALRDQLTNQVKRAAKVSDVTLSEQTDPDVIGGFRVETARHTWDKTVARRLSEIKGGI
ncbi:MAG TPA: F0F1 ATP synthase subunit delta [Candidatus Saccharimonadales bacterium]|nr:F0F1 ATP synthase subunit delta [Candidatus Saccharimonadales bacterium]